MNIQVVNHRFIANFRKYKFLLNQLVKRDIQIKYRRSVLGIFWSFLEPLFSMIVLTVVFSTFFKHTITNYPVYYLTGLLISSSLQEDPTQPCVPLKAVLPL